MPGDTGIEESGGRSSRTDGSSSVFGLFGPAVMSSITAASLGFLFWVLAARFYSASQVGTYGAAIALASGIGNLAAGGMYRVLFRVLPIHTRPRRLLWRSSLATAAIGAGLGLLAAELHLVKLSLPWLPFFVALASTLWSLFCLQDSILLSLGKTRALFLSNVGFGSTKLVLLVVLMGSAFGIALAWLIPLILIVPIVAWFADQTIAAAPRMQSASIGVTRQHVAAEYLNSIAAVTSIAGVPVITEYFRAGTFAGTIYVTWTLYVAADMINTWLSNSIVVNATEKGLGSDEAALRARKVIPMLLGAFLVIFVLAPQILECFGDNYVSATGLLRLLAIALAFRLLVQISLAARRVQGRYWRVVLGEVIFAIGVTASAALGAQAGASTTIGIGVIAAAIVEFAIVQSGTATRSLVVGSRARQA